MTKIQNQKRFNIKIFYFFTIVFMFHVSCFMFQANATELELVSEVKEIGVNQQFQVDLMLDPEGENINAIEGKISWPEDLLEPDNIYYGDSIVGLWIERPEKSQEVVFSGIIPGGFSGVFSPYWKGARPGKVFSLNFRAEKIGMGAVEIKDNKILLHDGRGTETHVKVSNFEFQISDKPSVIESEDLADSDPPESFKPEIARDPNVFEGKWFLVFSTQDKISGIDAYFVYESKRELDPGKIKKRKWARAESPYLLKDQNLQSYIYVKAVDKFDNERIEMAEATHLYNLWQDKYLILIFICGIIFMGIIIYIWAKYTRK